MSESCTESCTGRPVLDSGLKGYPSDGVIITDSAHKILHILYPLGALPLGRAKVSLRGCFLEKREVRSEGGPI